MGSILIRRRRWGLYSGAVACVLLAAVVFATQSTAEQPVNDASADNGTHASVIFAGGCFWCMEHPFDHLEGVVSTTSGYTGGDFPNPTYQQVSSGGTGHTEAVKVVYDPDIVSYEKLLNVFWRNVDPFDGGGQFCDRGSQYRPAIFYQTEEEQRLAEESKATLESAAHFDRSIAVEITPRSEFYPAEVYHQDYYKTHALQYKFYRYACGRDRRLENVWGDEAGGPVG